MLFKKFQHFIFEFILIATASMTFPNIRQSIERPLDDFLCLFNRMRLIKSPVDFDPNDAVQLTFIVLRIVGVNLPMENFHFFIAFTNQPTAS